MFIESFTYQYASLANGLCLNVEADAKLKRHEVKLSSYREFILSKSQTSFYYFFK